jgi:hypothetical protein
MLVLCPDRTSARTSRSIDDTPPAAPNATDDRWRCPCTSRHGAQVSGGRLGRCAIGQDHAQAENLIATVQPDGRELAKKLARVLAEKSNAHYGTTYLSGAETLSMIRNSRALVDALDTHLS